MSKKTTDGAPLTAKESYIKQFEILSAAGVGVILTRTREPHRCADALKIWTWQQNRCFKTWNVVRGWLQHMKEHATPSAAARLNQNAPTPDNVAELFMALKKVNDVGGTGQNKFPDGVYVMHFPHWTLPQHPQAVQMLMEYARDFTETKQRVVLLCPEGFTLPRELENVITILDFELPGQAEMRTTFENCMDAAAENSGTESPKYTEEEKTMICRSGGGMTEYEFDTGLSKAIITHRDVWPNVSASTINEILLKTKTEVVKRSEVLELQTPLPANKAGGLDLFKEWIEIRKGCFSEEAREFGVAAPKGCAIIGPPGTGKSLLAKITASLLEVPLIRFDVSRVFGSLIGQSEGRVRAALKQLVAMSPCVALIDEVDKAGIDPRQAGGDSGTSKRVIGSILTFMAECKEPIFWVFTANRVDGLPPELLRKGRLDEVFSCLLPTAAERAEVLKIHLMEGKQDVDAFGEAGIAQVVEASNGFSSAELESAVKEAITFAFSRKVEVTGDLVVAQLANMKPFSVAFKDDHDHMTEWAANNARPASSPEGAVQAPEYRTRAKGRKQEFGGR